jgi:hypothetical protein
MNFINMNMSMNMSAFGGRRGNVRLARVTVVGKDGDGNEVDSFQYDYTYQYGGKVVELINQIINDYEKKYRIVIKQDDVKVLSKAGIRLHISTGITDYEAGVKDPRLQVVVIIRDFKEQPQAQASAKTESHDVKKDLTLYCYDLYSDGTDNKFELKMENSSRNKVSDVKAFLIDYYKTNKHLSILPEDITIKSTKGNKLESTVWISDVTDTSNAKISAYVKLSVVDTDSADSGSADAFIRQDYTNRISNSSAARVADDVSNFFRSELKLDESDMEQLLLLLASTGICSMDALLGSNNEQILSLKLKPIQIKKLQKSLDGLRDGNCSIVVHTVHHSPKTVVNVVSSNSDGAVVKPVRPKVPQRVILDMVRDDDESKAPDEFKPDEAIIIATENLASTEELVAQLKDCADKIRNLIEVQDSNESKIEFRVDKARSYLSRRVTRLRRLIQEREKEGKVVGSATQSVSTGCGKGGKSELTKLSEKGERVDPIVKASAKKTKGRRITFDESGSAASKKEAYNNSNIVTSVVSMVSSAFNAFSSLVDVPSSSTTDVSNSVKSNITRGWKCTYCNNSENDPANSKCSNCSQTMYVASNASGGYGGQSYNHNSSGGYGGQSYKQNKACGCSNCRPVPARNYNNKQQAHTRGGYGKKAAMNRYS